MLTRGLEAMLFGVTSTDPTVFGVSAAVIATLGLVASLAPAHRAVSVDPRLAIASE